MRGERARGREVSLDFEGRQVLAFEGDSVASALTRHGVKVFGRSSKYHRPRGVRCANGTCSCCAMRVDGLPGVRACVTPVRDGMVIRREHAWPSADRDVFRVAGLAAPLLHAGSYYGWFRRSPRLWGITERALARVAGQGDLPDDEAARRLAQARLETRAGVDVLVVGGGPAGLSAARAAARAGARTLVVERHECLGGGLAGTSAGGAFSLAARAEPGLEILAPAEVTAWYEDGALVIVRGDDLVLVEPRAVVLAAGSHDLLLPFRGGDLPGVMSAGAARRLLAVHGVSPGHRALVVTADARGYALAAYLHGSGMEVVCVADLRAENAVPEDERGALRGVGSTVVTDTRDMRAHGWDFVRAVTLRTRAGAGAGPAGVRFACDLVCVAVEGQPATELAQHRLSGGAFALSAADLGGDEGPQHVAAGGIGLWLAGAAHGRRTPDAAVADGAAAGLAAARFAAAGAKAPTGPGAFPGGRWPESSP